MSSSLDRCLPTRLLVVLLVALLAVGLWSVSARADTSLDRSGEVGGLVLDRHNQPLPGATVTLTDAQGAVSGSADTDGQGRWSMGTAQGDYDLAVTARQDNHRLSAHVRRYHVGTDTKLNLVLAGDPEQTTVEAAAAADQSTDGRTATSFTRIAASVADPSDGMVTFFGTVLDADGDPVGAGVRISLSRSQPYFSKDVVVNSDGSFSLDVPPGSYRLDVTMGVPADDDCPGCHVERTAQATHDFMVENLDLSSDRQETIRLPRPSVLAVTVVDPSGRPVTGAWAHTVTTNPNPPAIADLLFPGTSTKVFTYDDQLTGADGTVGLEFIDGARPSTVSVDPSPGTFLPADTAFPLQANTVTIHLQHGPTLHGRLTGPNDTALPLTQAYLIDDAGRAYFFATSSESYAVTAPAGRYRMSSATSTTRKANRVTTRPGRCAPTRSTSPATAPSISACPWETPICRSSTTRATRWTSSTPPIRPPANL